MAKSYEELKNEISAITNEVEDGANTANRIGGAMDDIVNYTKESLEAQEERINEETDIKIEGLVVQETGDGENVVMSQKAVSGKLDELKFKTNALVEKIDISTVGGSYDYWGNISGDEGVFLCSEIQLTKGSYSFDVKLSSAFYCLVKNSAGEITKRFNDHTGIINIFLKEDSTLLLSSYSSYGIKLFKLFGDDSVYTELKDNIIAAENNAKRYTDIRLDSLAPKDYSIFSSRPIYVRKLPTSGDVIRFNNSLFPEGFVADNVNKLVIDGGRELALGVMGQYSGDSTEVHIVTNQEGVGKEISITNKVIDVAEIDSSKKALVLVIGESTTANQVRNRYSVGSMSLAGYNYYSMMMEQSIKDRIDGIGAEIISLGNTGADWAMNITYKEQTVSSFPQCIGHGGWSFVTYANWPCSAKMIEGSLEGFFTLRTMYYALGLASKTPYNQSTYNTNRTEYDGSDAQINSIANTPFGKYKMDGDAELWNFIKTISGTTDVSCNDTSHKFPVLEGASESYTGSDAQIEALNTWSVGLQENPFNELYSKSDARGTTAFSIPKYIQRYRTLDDNGVKLVCADDNPSGKTAIGSDGQTYTIGSAITSQKLLETINVCYPTHVIFNIGINDADSLCPTDRTLIIFRRLYARCGNAKGEQIPISHFAFRHPGACYIGAWSDVAIPQKYPNNIGHTKKLQEIHKKIWDWADSEEYPLCTPLDVWHIQPPCTSYYERLEDNNYYPTPRLDCSNTDVHVGYMAHKAACWQCVHWVYSTFVE